MVGSVLMDMENSLLVTVLNLIKGVLMVGRECIDGLGEEFTCNCIKSYLRCSNGGECIDGLGEEFTCNCTHGWTGDTCQENVDECQVNQSIC